MWKKLKMFVTRIKKFRKNYNSNRNLLLIFVSIVMVWRWIGNLLDMYFFPNYPVVSNLICIILWTFILMLDDGKLWELEWDLPKKS